jgi:hypothetical protein
MLYDIDLRVEGVEWLLQAFKELDRKEGLLAKALLGLTLSLRETGSLQEQELLLFLKENPKLRTSNSPSLKDVTSLKDELNIFFSLQPRVEDSLGEILDMEYRLIDRYLVLCFATIYDSCEAGGVEEVKKELAFLSYRIANKITYFPQASLSIGHLDHMLKEEGDELQKAIKWLTSKARHRW